MRAKSRLAPFSEPLPVPKRLISQKTPDVLNPRAATTEPPISVSFTFIYGPSDSALGKLKQVRSPKKKSNFGTLDEQSAWSEESSPKKLYRWSSCRRGLLSFSG